MPPTNEWTLLEPTVRCPDLRDSTQARLHDPLWFLARQWQFGEFWGNDVGSPATARLQLESARLTRYRPGALEDAAGAASEASDLPSALPLETLVEREPVRVGADGRPNARLPAEAGLHFLRLLDSQGVGHYRGAYVRSYPLAPRNDPDAVLDTEGSRFLDVVTGRVPDGNVLYRALRDRGGSLPSAPQIAAGDREKVLRAARSWIVWYEQQPFSEPGDAAALAAWAADRMEYRFSVSGHTSEGEMVLVSPEYSEGRLDWFSFVRSASASLGGTTAPSVASTSSVFLPAPVRFRGMPASRLWEFEDGRVNLGQVLAEGEDLARAILLEFGLVYGNDWFLVPLELEAGSLSRVASLVVTNTFGEQLLVSHASTVDGSGSPWQMFNISPEPRPSSQNIEPDRFHDVFFLPPALGPSLESEPVEEVLFLRDEMANLAWAVERVVEGEGGGRLDRLGAYQARRRLLKQAQEGGSVSPSDGASGASAHYRLGSGVPDYWIPLLPVQVEQGGRRPSIRLRRGELPVGAPDGSGGNLATPRPQGRILEPGQDLLLHDEEVPREGARISRAYQYVRGTDGSTYLWIGRRKRSGRGEGSSGLRFDFVENEPGDTPSPFPGSNADISGARSLLLE